MNAVEQYRLNRIRRLEKKYGKYHGPSRFDDDDDGNKNGNNGGGSKSGGHGNTRIPYGLCQREGIAIQRDWTPADAWKALEGKGYSASGVYKELRATGKVGVKSSVKAKKAPTKILESHFPEAMTSKAYKKNTMVFADYISEHCDDGEITEFFSLANAAGAHAAPNVKCKKVTSGEGCYISTSTIAGRPTESEIAIPDFSKIKDENLKAQAIRTFAHEWTHYIDFLARDDVNKAGDFSSAYKELDNAIKNNRSLIVGEEARKLFKEFDKQSDALRKEYTDRKKNTPGLVAKRLYGDDRPDWLDESGSIHYWGSSYWDSRAEVKRYQKELRKVEKAELNDFQRKNRAILDGVSSLQGIYDSLAGGELRESHMVKYGHSMTYFKRNPGYRAVEALADYVALKATNPKLAEVFIKDKPEIATAMDHCIADMTKKLRGGT